MNGSGDKGVLATHQGNAYRPGMATGTANAAGRFQKPAPVMQALGATTAGGAGKENATASRAAAAPPSTSAPVQQEEKRWQVRVDPIPTRQCAPTTQPRCCRASPARGVPPDVANGYTKNEIGGTLATPPIFRVLTSTPLPTPAAERLRHRQTPGPRQVRQRVPGSREEQQVHRRPQGSVQTAAAAVARRAPAATRDRDPVPPQAPQHPEALRILLRSGESRAVAYHPPDPTRQPLMSRGTHARVGWGCHDFNATENLSPSRLPLTRPPPSIPTNRTEPRVPDPRVRRPR